MGIPSNTLTAGPQTAAIGNREDLSDVIYRIDPTDTPFMSAIERETATAINHEWQTQALAAASTSNGRGSTGVRWRLPYDDTDGGGLSV